MSDHDDDWREEEGLDMVYRLRLTPFTVDGILYRPPDRRLSREHMVVRPMIEIIDDLDYEVRD